MRFSENPYYSPELCGLEILWSIDTGESYEYDMFVIWLKLDDDTIWYDTDRGCSCPSPFDNGDHGHDLKPITKDTFHGFEEALKHHYNIKDSDILEGAQKALDHLKVRRADLQ